MLALLSALARRCDADDLDELASSRLPTRLSRLTMLTIARQKGRRELFQLAD